jgi:hypothetical protein
VPAAAAGRRSPLTAQAAVLQVQRRAGNQAVATLLIQRSWTGDRVAEVRAAMTGPDWNRADGPWALLNGHNPAALAAIMGRLDGEALRQLRAHPPSAAYDTERLLFALSSAHTRGAAAELGGMDAIRNAHSGAITWAECWIALDKLSHAQRMTLYRGMDRSELRDLINHTHAADERRQAALEAEINDVIAPPVKDVRLDFVPDSSSLPGRAGKPWPMGKITVLVKGKPVTSIPARGGPWKSHADSRNPGHTADPTAAGTFTLEAGRPIVTSAWVFSQLADGTPIRDTGTDIEFESNGRWRSTRTLTKPLTRDDIMRPSAHTDLYRRFKRGELTLAQARKTFTDMVAADDFSPLSPTWLLNDFGTQGFAIKGTPGDIIHTTEITDDPTEALVPGDLAFSHGCVHILASDRDALIEQGFLRGGVKLTVHAYDPAKLPLWGDPPE